MIWLWIVLSVAVTALLLKGKNIAPHNFLWALLPIDKYGITIIGFTIKPVYIFSILLFAYAIISGKFRFKLPRFFIISSILFLTFVASSLLLRGNADLTVDINTYGMFFFTIVCAALSLSLVEGSDDLRQIQDVLIATAVGYGIVFIMLYALYNFGIVLPAAIGGSTFENSVLRSYYNLSGGTLIQTVRLRGFYTDANASNACFVVGLAALFSKWIKDGGKIIYIVYALIIAANVILTSSRSAFIILILITILSIFRFFLGKTRSHRKIIFFSILLSVLFIIFAVFMFNSKTFTDIFYNFIARYTNRSSLNDRYGRLTIWRDALSVLRDNWHCGVGIGNIKAFIDAERDAHNTFIEILCSSGIFVGIYYIFYFVSPLFSALKRRLTDSKNAFHLSTFIVIFLSVLLLNATVSNITSSYLIYLSILLFVIPRCLSEEDEKLSASSLNTDSRGEDRE